ncbi:LysR family transcriptional regulator [Microbacterium hominis]|uniref:LysR family transcriptional regulator n=1 Tax=Microbacterium hominis TaxID=162426 RepID=A0A0B4CBR7_9MICO|nr:LysR family transcriptional regulator [Microbacterium hominis]KIC58724.1 LysR family transcriptional regulator [Microbacterium hominis]
MDTRLLEYFVAVAEESSFTRAAARLYVVQSTVSAGIQTLEQRMGTRLIERSGRRVALTAAGEHLLEPAREIVDATSRLQSAATGRIEGLLRVGIFVNLPTLRMPELFAAFRAQHPLVRLRLVSSPSGSTGLADELRRGRIDLAFMGLPSTELPDLETVELVRSPFVALLPDAHELSALAEIPVERLATEAWIDAPHGFGHRVLLERALARAGLVREVATEVSAVGDIPSFVAAGFGVALVPEVLVVPTTGTIAVPVTPVIEWPLSVSTRPHAGPAAMALREVMVQRFAVD